MAHIECVCPLRADGATRHPEGDDVTLRKVLDFVSARTVRNVIAIISGADEVDDADILAALTEKYLYLGIESWTLVDAKGKDIPVTRSAIAQYLLPNQGAAEVVADEADDLYTESVVLPLLARRSTSSQPTPTGALTSVPTDSPTRRRKPSSPSSTITSPTDGIARISASPGGASN